MYLTEIDFERVMLPCDIAARGNSAVKCASSRDWHCGWEFGMTHATFPFL